MKIKQFELWIADRNPQNGTEPGKRRPVVVIQTDLLNDVGHPSTVIAPLTTNVQKKANLLRVHIEKGDFGLNKDSDIMVDQIRTIDNKRLIEKIGVLSKPGMKQLKANLKIILDLEYEF